MWKTQGKKTTLIQVHVLAHLLAVCLKGQKQEAVKTITTLWLWSKSYNTSREWITVISWCVFCLNVSWEMVAGAFPKHHLYSSTLATCFIFFHLPHQVNEVHLHPDILDLDTWNSHPIFGISKYCFSRNKLFSTYSLTTRHLAKNVTAAPHSYINIFN